MGKTTILFETHNKMGAKMIEFAGFDMPVQYEGMSEEHHAVRNKVGMFDVSHMGEIKITGKDANLFTQYIITNDIDAIKANEIIYTLMCNEKGGVVDDILIYKYSNEDILLIVNASNIEKDYAWIADNAKTFDVKVENISDKIGQIAVQGPNAEELLNKLVDIDLKELAFFNFTDDVTIANEKCMISRSGYTGEDGFEIYAKNESIVNIWNSILEMGKDFDLKPCGLGCRDTLRFEALLPLYGNEMNDDITPLEAGLSYFVKLNKENFIGKDALVAKNNNLDRKLVVFEVEKGIPRNGYDVLVDGEKIGFVTTGYVSPTLNRTVGTAIIDTKYAVVGSEIDIQIRKKLTKGKIIPKKLYSKNYKK